MKRGEMSLRSKLLTMTVGLLSVMSAVTLWESWSAWKSAVAFEDANRNETSQERSILFMTIDFKKQVQEWKDFLLRGKDPAAFEKYWNAFEKKERDIQQSGTRLLSQVKDEVLRKRLSEFLAAHQKMGEDYRRGLAAFKDAGMESKAGDSAVKGMDRAPTQLLEQTAKMIAEKHDRQLETDVNKAKDDVINSLALFAIAVVLMLAAQIWFIRRFISRPLGGEPATAIAIANQIAAGDLSQELQVSEGDASSLMAAMKRMQNSLVKIVSQVRIGTDAIASASQQIAAGNANLSSRTEEQASSLEETASSMEELTSTVKQNAENARQANQLAQGASAVALKGGDVVDQVVGTMTSINESSKKIADIIGVIDGIAFQTNILALNAAVEAARAGEQGRGFAVVASEVRNLAQRSAAAAKEIKELIGDSVVKVGAGTKLVDEAGQTMQEIVASVKRVTDIMAEITAASQEQSAGIEQVNQAITQMDQVTQQNAALVEDAATAAESLGEQARVLARAVTVFNIGSAHAATPSAQDAPAAKSPTRHEPPVQLHTEPFQPAADRPRPVRAKNVAARR